MSNKVEATFHGGNRPAINVAELGALLHQLLSSPIELRDEPYSKHELLALHLIEAGYSRPRTIATVEALAELPAGTVVVSETYVHHAHGMRVSFQRWPDGRCYRGARSSDTHPEYIIPATILWEPTP